MLKVRNHSKAGMLKTLFSASLLLCSTAAMILIMLDSSIRKSQTMRVDR